MTYSIDSVVQATLNRMHQNYDSAVLAELDTLIEKGILVIASTYPVLVRDEHSPKLRIEQAVKITCQEQDYITKLEQENKELKAIIERIKTNVNVTTS